MNKNFRPWLSIFLLLQFGSFISAASAISIITEWNPVIIDTVIANKPAPTPSTHVLSSVFSAAYDAWAAYDPVALGAYSGNTLDVTGGTVAERNEAISHAIYSVLNTFAPLLPEERNNFMASKGYLPSATSQAALIGRAAAQAVMDFRVNDNSNQTHGYADTTGYAPRPATEPDAWQPLVVNGVTQAALTPHWGLVTPFALTGPGQFLPPPPAQPGSQHWNDQIQQLITLSAGLTPVQKAIAEYWRPARGTPPMLLAGLTAYVSQIKGYGLDDDVRLFFAIHNAMFDAGITCWKAKFHYDYIRPITAIRNLGDVPILAWGGPDQGTKQILASEWHPYQKFSDPTPPFPEYTSGHSTFSSAWAEIMRTYTGSDFFGGSVEIADLAFEQGHFDPPIVLFWPTFTAAAEEAGISRLYGGIHFMDANRYGISTGTLAGKTAWQRASGLFQGHDNPRLDPRCDINNDGMVDDSDLLLLMTNWHHGN